MTGSNESMGRRIANQREEIRQLERQLRELRERQPGDIEVLRRAIKERDSHLARSIHRGQAAEDDLQQIGEAFVSLYLQALNGVVCDPSEQLGPRTLCSSCNEAWEKGQAVLNRRDGQWGNMYRGGPCFQLGAPGPKTAALPGDHA